MLTVDRKVRITLDEVLNHPWVIEGYPGPPKEYLISLVISLVQLVS